MLNRSVTYLCTHSRKVMIKKVSVGISCLLLTFLPFSRAFAQMSWPSPEAEQLYNQARQYLSNGNLRQAIPLYQQAIAIAPDQVILYRDLSNAWYLSGNYEQADKTIEPVIESGKADEQCYQIAAASKNAQKEDKKVKKILAAGLSKYPHSGLLYHEWGKFYDDQNDEESALKKWLDGISADPLYRINYYDAARTYFLTKKPVWALLYGEIFINMEPNTPRSYETRKLLMSAYKKIFMTATEEVQAFGKSNANKPATSFEEAVLQTLMKLAPVVSDGVNAENLIMLRTRFIMDWQANYGQKYPFSLFAYQDDLLRYGYFDAYNQWLFGKVENAQQHEGWLKFHPQAISSLEKWQAAHPLRPSVSDGYNEGKLKGLLPQNPYKR